ncbi:MAG: pimeloyl-ACP methyl ester carboxylesterase [Enterobacterales bacterium]|jgi:pimeloyl-ACP methyl ester carboxylesterase
MKGNFIFQTMTKVLTIAVICTVSIVFKADDKERVFDNEKEIVFENDGQKIKAYSGSIQVPERRSNASSRLIPVKYVRFPATGKKTDTPIIYLSGGPGGSGISTAQYPGFRFPLFMALREFGDVIALDQRGTGQSKDAPSCTSNQKLPTTQRVNYKQVTDIYTKAAKECMEFWKENNVDVYGYTTVESAYDINDLRKHFGADKVTLWGISYGSHLAFASLKEMKGHIEKIVIASAEGLDQTVKLPARTDAYFERLQLAVNQQPKAAAKYPNINDLIRNVHQSLDKNPIMVKISRKDGTEYDFLFQTHHMQILASMTIADPGRGLKMLLNIYHSLEQGSTDVLNQVLERGYFNDDNISFNVMSFAMDVASGISDKRHQLIDKQAKSSLLGHSLNFPMPQLDRAITGLDLGDDFRAYPRSDVPTLLLTGTLDGRTYIESQKEATQGLTNLTQVMVVNAGHNLFRTSPKVTEVIKDFLGNKAVTISEIKVKLPTFVDE